VGFQNGAEAADLTDRSALDDDELAVASITIAEYRTGIELADTPERAGRGVTARDAPAPAPLGGPRGRR
jgi:hypothetical protein